MRAWCPCLDVARVDGQRSAHDAGGAGKAKCTEGVPFGHDHRIGTRGGLVGIVEEGGVRNQFCRLLGLLGIAGARGGAGILQCPDDRQSRRIAHIVSFGLEDQSRRARPCVPRAPLLIARKILRPIACLRARMTETTALTFFSGASQPFAGWGRASVSPGTQKPP